MPRIRCLLGALTGLTLLACDHSRPLAPTSDPRAFRASLSEQDDGDLGSASGKGHYDILGLDVQFEFAAEQRNRNESADGEFRVYADEGGGLIVDFTARVTCLAIDAVNHRAWIGGKVTSNQSTDPDLTTKIHQRGDDIWFRVLDEGDADRSTFIGFEGAAGFKTSADYCVGRPWPAENARTWPVVQGGLTVRP
ncbi:MAG TPA: hypothetical protein VGQ06_07330 [Gemmatimonadales bacterium]|jgi:hypothetical protein|nr:hypothetical protein [Gemmatimonadales bacterium]